nr:copper resistance protein A homolog [Nerophis lumbriciformis]
MRLLSLQTYLALLIVTTAAAQERAAGSPAPSAAPNDAAFHREFVGSYPKQAPPSKGVKSFTITAAPTEVKVFNGHTLAVWAYNAQVPGPTLRVRLGETVRVEFINRLPQPSTIHWHGVRVPNAMDGVPEVTQAPVPPGGKFVYEFTPKDAGTFWFHPHVRSSEQVERGLYGVLIVEDPEPPAYSQEVLWVLDDWLITREGQIDPNFITRRDLAHDGRWGNVVTVNARTDQVLQVKAGERIRLRLLNAANGRVFEPDFSNFEVEAIAVDGMYAARAFDPAGFEIAPGNRLDLDLRIPTGLAGETLPIIDRFTRSAFQVAQIEVLDEVVKTPDFPSQATASVPVWSGAEQTTPQLSYLLNAESGGEYGLQWTMNGEAYPEVSPGRLATDQWAKIQFENVSARLHPMHIHGLFFKLLSRNGKPVDEPFWRDTVLVHSRETVEIGTVPLDEGRWLMHCHILEHAAAGMKTILEVEGVGKEGPAVAKVRRKRERVIFRQIKARKRRKIGDLSRFRNAELAKKRRLQRGSTFATGCYGTQTREFRDPNLFVPQGTLYLSEGFQPLAPPSAPTAPSLPSLASSGCNP